MDSFKTQLRTAYDADAQRRDDGENRRESWKQNCREYFVSLLKQSKFKSILELGAGVGIDSKYFQDSGFDVLATDLSENMVSSCKSRGLAAQTVDLYDLKSLLNLFDGVYSMNVLLHVPRKDLSFVLDSIADVLPKGGIFFYGVYGGMDEEKVIVDNKKMGLPRFFSFLSDSSIQSVVATRFKILKFEAIDIGSNDPHFHFQSLYLQKKS